MHGLPLVNYFSLLFLQITNEFPILLVDGRTDEQMHGQKVCGRVDKGTIKTVNKISVVPSNT